MNGLEWIWSEPIIAESNHWTHSPPHSSSSTIFFAFIWFFIIFLSSIHVDFGKVFSALSKQNRYSNFQCTVYLYLFPENFQHFILLHLIHFSSQWLFPFLISISGMDIELRWKRYYAKTNYYNKLVQISANTFVDWLLSTAKAIRVRKTDFWCTRIPFTFGMLMLHCGRVILITSFR